MPLIKACEAQRLTREAYERSLEPIYEIFNNAITSAADDKKSLCTVYVGNIDTHQIDCVYESLECNGFRVLTLFYDDPSKFTLQILW